MIHVPWGYKLFRHKNREEQVMTQSGSDQDAQLTNSPDYDEIKVNRDVQAAGNPADIRDPHNINPGSPIEGATWESVGLGAEQDEAIRSQRDNSTDSSESSATASSEGSHEVASSPSSTPNIPAQSQPSSAPSPSAPAPIREGENVSITREDPEDEEHLS